MGKTGPLPPWAKTAGEKLGVVPIPWSTGEVHSPCPECGGRDRFVIWETGRAWCRKCNTLTKWKDVSKEELETVRIRRKKKSQASFLRMSSDRSWIQYHERCVSSPAFLALWADHGIEEETVRRWGLGYCKRCPTFPERPSLTIPVFGAGQLLDIRHRILNPTPTSGKYRSHIPGLSVDLFNRDALRAKRVVVVEGSKKAIVLDSFGILCCGTYGTDSYRELLAISKGRRLDIYLAFDPDAERQAYRLAGILTQNGSSVHVCHFCLKPDDFVLRYGIEITNEVFRQAMKV